MSYDLWVNAPGNEVVRKELFTDKMLSEGWEIRFLQGDAFWDDRDFELLPAVGRLDEHILLAGWCASQTNSDLLADLFACGETQKLIRLFMDKDAFGTCGLYVHVSEQKPGETKYSFQPSKGNINSWELVHAVWEAIGELSNGEMVNPQEGSDAFLYAEEQSRVME